jgi:hypothetical protein
MPRVGPRAARTAAGSRSTRSACRRPVAPASPPGPPGKAPESAQEDQPGGPGADAAQAAQAALGLGAGEGNQVVLVEIAGGDGAAEGAQGPGLGGAEAEAAQVGLGGRGQGHRRGDGTQVAPAEADRRREALDQAAHQGHRRGHAQLLEGDRAHHALGQVGEAGRAQAAEGGDQLGDPRQGAGAAVEGGEVDVEPEDAAGEGEPGGAGRGGAVELELEGVVGDLPDRPGHRAGGGDEGAAVAAVVAEVVDRRVGAPAEGHDGQVEAEGGRHREAEAGHRAVRDDEDGHAPGARKRGAGAGQAGRAGPR